MPCNYAGSPEERCPANKALLDTDIDSEVLKAKNQTVAQNAAAYRQPHGVYTVSVVTVMEVVQGFHRVQNARRLLNFLNAVGLEQMIVFDRSAAELAGRISADLERTGQNQNIGLADPRIAAVALQHGPELVTGNTAHFQRIQQLGYSLILANCAGSRSPEESFTPGSTTTPGRAYSAWPCFTPPRTRARNSSRTTDHIMFRRFLVLSWPS